MSNYKPTYPCNVDVDAGIKNFITTFYRVSDTPGKDKEWAKFFRDDATLVMENMKATGKTEIMKVREGMWEKIESRRHTVFKVFPASFGQGGEADGSEVVHVMLHGNVAYKLKGGASREDDDGWNGGGEEAVVDWAGHARLARHNPGRRRQSGESKESEEGEEGEEGREDKDGEEGGEDKEGGEGEEEWKFAYYQVYIQK